MTLGKNKTKYVVDAVIIVIVTALTVLYLFKSGVLTAESLSKVTFIGFAVCFLAFIASGAVNAVIDLLIYRTFTGEIGLKRAFLTTVFGHFGSSITPFRSGHFPLKAYYHYKDGVSPDVTVTGFVKCQIIYSAVSVMAYFSIALYLLITGLTADIGGVTVRLWLVVAIGFLFHVAVFVCITVLSFNQRLQRSALKLLCKVIKKLRKNFDAESFFSTCSEKLERFKDQIKIIGKSFYRYLAPAFLYLAYMLLNGSVPYAAYLMSSGGSFYVSEFFTFYILNLASVYIANVIPLPGGTGTSEVLFTVVFAHIIADPLLGATLVLWRISSFYFPIILEFICFLFVALRKKARRDHGVRLKSAEKSFAENTK